MLRSATARRLLAVGLVLIAVAAVTPAIAIGYVWTASAWLAMWATETGNGLSLGFGIMFLLAPLVFGALSFAAVGVWRGVRGAYWLGWIGLVAAVSIVFGPLGNISAVSWLPGGLLVMLALGIACAVLLVTTRPPRAESGKGWGRTGFALLGGYVVVVAVFAVVAASIGGLPNDPWFYLTSGYEVGPAEPRPLPPTPVQQNPHMAKFPWAAIHNDSDQSDMYPQGVGVDPATGRVSSFASGGVCASLTWDSHGHLVAMCVSDAVTAYVIDPATMTPLATYKVSDRPLTADFFTNFGGGGYMYLDNRDRIVTPTLRQSVLVISQRIGADGSITLAPAAEYNLKSHLQPGEKPTSVLPDSSGRLWFVGQQGSVGYIEPTTGAIRSRAYPNEDIENSFSVGSANDVYVVTSAGLKRLTASAGGVRQVWSSPYESIGQAKPGQTSAASGTTPTLHGDGLVSIADNADQLHVDVFRIKDGSRLCSVPVFGPGNGATENSLIAVGSDLLVENNYGYRLLEAVGGHAAEPGVSRVNVDQSRGRCGVAWTNSTVRVPSVVSKASAGSGVMLTYTKDSTPLGLDNWWLTALDLRTGQLAWRRLLGSGSARNNHYAALYSGPDGGIYIGTTMGIVALRDE